METARILSEATLAHDEAGHLPFAFAALWLDERREDGNDRLRQWFGAGHRTEEPLDLLLERPDEFPAELGRAIAGVKWSARTWLRIYFLFSSHSQYFPGRLEPDVEEKIEELAWALARHYSTLERADPKYLWAIAESENHDMMDFSNAFLALQVVKDLPRLRDRKMRDGHSPREHHDAWTRYYREYCRERAAYGLFVEIASPIYGKHFLGELFNMHDFASDPALRREMGMLLDITWADWAIDQLGGVRGGGKTRAYMGHYAQRGTSDSWYIMGNFLFDRPTAGQLDWAARHGQVEFTIATSGYELPEVVAAIADDPEGRGEFEYISRRPARMVPPGEVRDRPPLRAGGTWYHLDPEDSRLVRYSFCTPDYVMGSLLIDPALGSVLRLEPDGDYPQTGNYAAISTQSRWQGIVFPTDPNARVFPQCVGEHSRDRVNFSQHIAVQHQNVMLVRKHHKAELAGGMRVFFAAGMKERIVERDGWLFLHEGDAFLAVGVLPGLAPRTGHGYRWEGDNWIHLDDEFAPVVFVASRTRNHESLENFIEYVRRQTYSHNGDKVEYAFITARGEEARLALYLGDNATLPEIDGRPIDLSPERVYDSPFLFAEHGSPRVTIRKGGRELVHDFKARESKVEPMDWSLASPADVSDADAYYHELFATDPAHSLAYYLGHFHTLANAVRDREPNRGFIDLPVWRRLQDNAPYNARVMENIHSLVWFFTKDESWNPYYGDPAVRARLEKAMRFWLSIQNEDGRFSEYAPGRYALAPTAFATKFMSESLVLLRDGPPMDQELLDQVREGTRRALLFTLTNESFYRGGQGVTNQYTNAFAGALAYLSIYEDQEMEHALVRRMKSAAVDFQSPAGYMYEGHGPDWGYYFGTHHSNVHMIWHYGRDRVIDALPVGRTVVEEYTKSTEWLAYNAVPQPDGAQFFLNRAIETRQARHGFERLNTPLSEKVPLARAFHVTEEERQEQLARNRRELEAHWGNPPGMDPSTFTWTTYSPYGFLHRNHGAWYPTAEQRREAQKSLPYFARDRFVHQRVDGVRRDCTFTYVRRPGYYAAFNSGEHYRRQQRLGIGLIWHPEFGTLVQSQTNSNDFAWGTRSLGDDALAEAATIEATFSIDGNPVSPQSGARDLPHGGLEITYPVLNGSKHLRFADDRIEVEVSTLQAEDDQTVSFIEQIPLLLADGDLLKESHGTVSLWRNGRAILEIRFQDPVQVEIQEGPAVGDLTLQAVRARATGALIYKLVFAPAPGSSN